MARITNYFKTVAREVRDIPTAFATEVNAGARNAEKSVANLKTQVKEAAKAVVTGKSGTSSDQGTSAKDYTPGKKR
jgi:uncharacterized protein YoxC